MRRLTLEESLQQLAGIAIELPASHAWRAMLQRFAEQTQTEADVHEIRDAYLTLWGVPPYVSAIAETDPLIRYLTLAAVDVFISSEHPRFTAELTVELERLLAIEGAR